MLGMTAKKDKHMDAIRLKNMQFYAYHGNKPHEAENGQRFEVDVELTGNFQVAALSDDLKDTYDFDRIYQIVSEIVSCSRFNLLEALTEEICRRLLKDYPNVQVRVAVRKPHPSIAGVLDYAEVELVRK